MQFVFITDVYPVGRSVFSLLTGRLFFKLLKLSEKNIDRVVGRVHTGLISAGRVGEREREEGGGTCFVKNGLGRSRDCFLLLPAACREASASLSGWKMLAGRGSCAHVLSQPLPSSARGLFLNVIIVIFSSSVRRKRTSHHHAVIVDVFLSASHRRGSFSHPSYPPTLTKHGCLF